MIIIFYSVWFLSKKVIRVIFSKKTKPKPVQTNRFRFGLVILEQKPVLIWFDFFGLARFFFCFFDSVRFFQFQAYKTKTKPVSFLKILSGLIGFFSRFSFLVFFSPLPIQQGQCNTTEQDFLAMVTHYTLIQ